MIDINELRMVLARHGTSVLNEDEILELLDRLEEAEKDITLKERVIDSLGSKLNTVANERDALQAKVEALREQLSKQRSLSQAAQHLAEVAQRRADALQAKIEAMEKQEPVAWMDRNGTLYNTVSHVLASDKPLYLAPCAKGE